MKTPHTDEIGNTEEISSATVEKKRTEGPKSNSVFNWEAYYKFSEKNPSLLQGANIFEFFGNSSIRSNHVSEVPNFVVEIIEEPKEEVSPKVEKQEKLPKEDIAKKVKEILAKFKPENANLLRSKFSNEQIYGIEEKFGLNEMGLLLSYLKRGILTPENLVIATKEEVMKAIKDQEKNRPIFYSEKVRKKKKSKIRREKKK